MYDARTMEYHDQVHFKIAQFESLYVWRLTRRI